MEVVGFASLPLQALLPGVPGRRPLIHPASVSELPLDDYDGHMHATTSAFPDPLPQCAAFLLGANGTLTVHAHSRVDGDRCREVSRVAAACPPGSPRRLWLLL